MKHEWRKHEKNIYVPKTKPEIINIPAFKFFTIAGSGDPNKPFFADYVSTLYSLAYAVKMFPKKGITPENYFEYTVYPLEGIWDLEDEAKQNYNGELNKDMLKFNLMIRQPDFVSEDFAYEIIKNTIIKTKNELLEKVKFETIEDGASIQMLHIGSYDSENVSFTKMEEFCTQNNYKRKEMTHREIYLSDPRKVSAEKLKTILRFGIVN